MLIHLIHQAPQSYEQPGTRWKLKTLIAAGPGLRLKSEAGMCQILKRLKISRKRARHHVHSPDEHYVAKLNSIRLHLRAEALERERAVLVFEDEFSLYRHPSLAFAYESLGKLQPFAELGWSRNSVWRIAAGLNAWTGQVSYEVGNQITVSKLVKLYQKLRESYAHQDQIYVVEDNWPVHFHPDLLASLQPQDFPFGLHVPRNWPTTPRKRVKPLNLPIQILCLPTYASWANPIEKLWRYLKQELLHLHRFADDWEGLRQAVTQFLDQFVAGSKSLLRYVGLEDPNRLYRSLFLPNAPFPIGGI